MGTNLLLNLGIILIITKTFGILTRRIHLPQVVGALFAGIVLGPAFLGIIRPDELFETLAELGVILLMFTAGLETDFKQLRQALKPSILIAVLGVILPLAGGLMLMLCFGGSIQESFFIGVILTATSVSITVETLKELGKFKTKSGATILGAAVIDDILGVICLSVMLGISGGALSIADVAFIIFKIMLFFIFAAICGLAAFKLFEYLSSKWGMVRRISVFGLAFCFLMSYLAELFGVAAITGAYIAGLVLCNSKAEKYIEEKSTVLSFLFFSPIFFVSVGLKTSFAGFDGRTILFAVLLFAVAVITKIVGCGLGAKISSYTSHESLQVGVGMISRGEVAIIVASIGMAAGFIDSVYFSGLIIAVIATTLITPILLKLVFNEKSTPPA
ncbi:MAG: cation:proton antiporter [Defluviitaleaceae bacterium]|nr:cation:proton antiporter [Defluviitaleaceae bacterium]